MCIFSLQAGLPSRTSCDPLDLSLPLACSHPDCVSTGSCGVQHPACPRCTYSTRPHLCPTPRPSPKSTALRLPLLSQSPAASALPASFASSASPDSTVHHSVQSLAVVSVFFLLSLHLARPSSSPDDTTPAALGKNLSRDLSLSVLDHEPSSLALSLRRFLFPEPTVAASPSLSSHSSSPSCNPSC